MTATIPSTIAEMFVRQAAAGGDTVALLTRRSGTTTSFTWNELQRRVFSAAAGLARLGVKRGDAVAQLSENRLEWLLADLAIHTLGAVHVPLHATLAAEQITWQLRHSEAVVLFLSGPAQAAKLAVDEKNLSPQLRFVSHDPVETPLAGSRVLPFAELHDAADESAGYRLYEKTISSVTASDLASILYTSGTTGEPKGVMLTHGNLVSNACSTLAAYEQEPSDIKLCSLPLSHIYARTCDFYTWLAGRSTLALAENRETVIADCQAIRPTMLNSVPYFYDKVVRHLIQAGRDREPGALRALLGGRVRMCCSGGAPLPDAVFDFFESHEVPLRQGYGLSETSPVISLSNLRQFQRGTVGRPIADVEVKIAADGEVLTRGPHVMRGYWKDDAATAAAMQGGWFHTGDLGKLTHDGYLKITGRKKELIVTSLGKKVVPSYLEGLLTQDPLIAQALVIGEGKKYLAALIVPNPEGLRAAIIQGGIPVASAAEALVHPQVIALVEAHIRERLAHVSPHEQVRRCALLPRAFSQELGEMTPKLTLRRDLICRNFSAAIEKLYAEGDVH